MIRLLVVLGVVFSLSAQSRGTDHNGDAYQALCGVLGSAVKKWVDVKNRSKDDPLHQALAKTIFGKKGEQDLEKLRGALPDEYHVVEGSDSSRGLMCGPPRTAEHVPYQARWPGHSVPHDLLCLCTPGETAWLTTIRGSGAEKLCGKDAQTFVDSEGWADNGYEGGVAQMTTTWLNVTVPCLKGDESAGDLKSVLQKFKDNLGGPVPGHPASLTLGEGDLRDAGACDGTPDGRVCVFYENTTHRFPWWTELEQALATEEQKRYTEKAHTPPSTSRHSSSLATEPKSPDSNASTMPRPERLRNNAPVTQPLLCLPGVASWLF
ncbi:Variant surface glycoprotein [Trypanosoma congolense IL3000]|uniref:Variant surface glycoprotein n=1 Tax=Trypanosoma congolense (strain IL3000) TaxID=1068625 RepID=F9WBS5_TRYCI|nr:Variant surface glycoprotein [Trypanosoma congolense IL3000]